MPNLNLKNFAKIQDSDFDIQDITVFAGKPGSGKSYIMKTLYAIDEAFRLSIDSYSDIAIETLDNEIILKEMIKKRSNKEDIGKILSSFKKKLLELKEKEIDYLPKNNAIDTIFNKKIQNLLKAIFSDFNQISQNFEVKYNTVKITHNNSEIISELDTQNQFLAKNSVFVETPLILEFKQFMNREDGKTPYHIESLLKILDKDFSFTDSEQDEFIKSFVEKSKQITNGSIENSGDSFIFKTDNRDYNIINASSGIKSIGLLQYLVTNKALKKGSTLYWEEPEVHLHPTWQLKMVDLFVELMNAGVKVVFSTHSPYMADYLNAKAQKGKFRDKVSFNLLNEEESEVSNTILNDDNWNLLQDELLGSLEDIMWQYL